MSLSRGRRISWWRILHFLVFVFLDWGLGAVWSADDGAEGVVFPGGEGDEESEEDRGGVV